MRGTCVNSDIIEISSLIKYLSSSSNELEKPVRGGLATVTIGLIGFAIPLRAKLSVCRNGECLIQFGNK